MMWIYFDSIGEAVINVLKFHSSSIIAIANIILILFIFIEMRDRRKPIIITKVITRNKEVTDRPDVLESGDTLFIAILNNSKNIAKSINIDYRFNFNGRSIKVKEKKLSHLNPEEATKIVLKTKSIREKCPEIFEEVTEGNVTKRIPKKTLKIDLIVTIRYNPIIGFLFKYKLEDNYEIEWGSRESYPNFRDLVFRSLNKRNGEYYIDKTSGREFTEEIEDSNEW
jgi:hypothetical protein